MKAPKKPRRRPWTDRQLAYLRRHYADMTAADIALKVHHPVECVWLKAKALGLSKSPEFLARWGRRVAATDGARAHRFQPGQAPANKGKRQEQFMSADGIARSSRTRFQPGQKSHNTRPVGYERIDKKDGYIYIKTSDTEKMQLKHRYLWQQAHGPVPQGYVVAFRDGNRLNCTLENLYLLSRADNARRRIASETPEQRALRVARCQATRNKSIRRDRIRIHWGLEPKGRLVKRW